MHFKTSYSLAFQINFIFAIVDGECSIQQQSFMFVHHYAISFIFIFYDSLSE